MKKYNCTNCLKEFTSKLQYTLHINLCINNINKVKENSHTIINETIDINNNIINKINIIIQKKIELNTKIIVLKSIRMNYKNKSIADMNKSIIDINIALSIINNSYHASSVISLATQNNITEELINKVNKDNIINEIIVDKDTIIKESCKENKDKNDINTELFRQEKGLKRNTIDKYYTKLSVVKLCIELIRKNINISTNDLIIEPSAGNGSFISNIKTLSPNYKFYDLEPEHNEVWKQDFLEFDYKKVKQQYANIHIIGNPPFGRQASLAIKFIKKCCLFSNSISFILPKSFKKDSMKKYFEKHYHLIYEIDLLENSFLVNGIESNVPCVFQIWEYKEEIRNEIDKQIPINFKFVEKKASPDISFRRVGVNAGTIMREINDKSIQSHYFIKFTNNKTIDENIEKLKLLKFDFDNTVGPKSISKPELINEFNKLLI